MATIVIRDDLREILEEDAARKAKTINQLVNEAIEQYLREQQRAKLDQEIAAYETMHAELWQKYPDQWVAIHQQKLVDQDDDRIALYRRIRAAYGPTAILLRQVKETPIEEVQIHTPSTGKLTS